MRPQEKGPWRKGNRQAARGERRIRQPDEWVVVEALAWAALDEAADRLGPEVYQIHPEKRAEVTT